MFGPLQNISLPKSNSVGQEASDSMVIPCDNDASPQLNAVLLRSADVLLPSCSDSMAFRLEYNPACVSLCYPTRCGHCKNLAPQWKRAAGSLKGQVNFGQVDCTVEEVRIRRLWMRCMRACFLVHARVIHVHMVLTNASCPP